MKWFGILKKLTHRPVKINFSRVIEILCGILAVF